MISLFSLYLQKRSLAFRHNGRYVSFQNISLMIDTHDNYDDSA